VQKAIAILKAGGIRPSGATIAEFARAARLPRPTAARLIATLADEGFLSRRDGGDTYVLGPELARLGSIADLGGYLVQFARAPLERVLAICEETVMLQLPRGGQIEVVLQLDPPKLLGGTNWEGRHFPLYASSAGKILIATWSDDAVEAFLRAPLEQLTPRTITDPAVFRREIERVREDDYALVIDELEMGLSSVSVPVRDVASTLIGVISVCAPTVRFGAEVRRHAATALHDAARAIGQLQPGGRPPQG
jgi:IclR family transcriptional regulator, acetate operon repressor